MKKILLLTLACSAFTAIYADDISDTNSNFSCSAGSIASNTYGAYCSNYTTNDWKVGVHAVCIRQIDGHVNSVEKYFVIGPKSGGYVQVSCGFGQEVQSGSLF